RGSRPLRRSKTKRGSPIAFLPNRVGGTSDWRKNFGAYPLDACKHSEYIWCMTRTKGPSLRQFQDRFPTEDSCLDHLFQVRYAGTECPKCNRPVRYTRVKGRRAYQCQWCANFLYPTAGTPFARTRTSL